MSRVESRLSELNLTLPSPAAAAGNYLPAKAAGDLLYLSGALPFVNGELTMRGKVGGDVTIEQGQAAARTCTLNLLAAIKASAGSLDRVAQVVSIRGYVNCGPDFTEQPAVINGASDLLVQIFGDNGRHARAAVGVSSLPKSAAVEIEMVVQLKPG
ncbi:MAG: RidA family protein [Verrucomicrobia bacterium]|nr:RidA family protein [Verrucomicrobiota bacterium]